MAFIVEDGTGLADATSYVTVQEYRDYYTDRGKDTSSETDINIQGYLVQATEFIDLTYSFKGEVLLATQALEFPRVIDDEETGVPVKLKYATINMGEQVKNLPDGGSLYLDDEVNLESISEKVGSIETSKSYATSGDRRNTDPEDWYPKTTSYLSAYIDASLPTNQRRVTSG